MSSGNVVEQSESDFPLLVFAIPLGAREIYGDWDLVQNNLRRTIQSIRGNGGENYRIVVACNQRADLEDCDTDDLTIVVVPFAAELDISKRGEDKARKRRFIASWLRERLGREGCYIAFLDADDLVNKRLVDYIVAHDNRRSYVAEKGYLFHTDTKILECMDAGFAKVCGSGFVGYFRKDELPGSWDDVGSVFSQFGVEPSPRAGMVGHGRYAELAQRLGKQPDLLPFYSVVYMTNHPESLRHQTLGRRRAANIHRMMRPTRAREILSSEFGAGDLLPASSMVGSSVMLLRGAFLGLFRRIRRRLRI